jgi:SAM-dependent methyltransferase
MSSTSVTSGLPNRLSPGVQLLDRDINGEVVQLYEDYPYPDHGVVSGVMARMATDQVRSRQVESRRSPLRVLDAGCGTGEQTLGLVRAFPELDITGVDISEASIRRAAELSAKHGLRATFRAADILGDLRELGSFDLVVSVGVVHHLTDPALALRNLRAVAEPGARLLGMVYGSFGKWDSSCVRDALHRVAGSQASRSQLVDYIQQARVGAKSPLLAHLEEFDRRRRFGPSVPLLEALRRVAAGRGRSYLADAYTHVQELSYTWHELNALLESTNWSLEGWPPHSGMPDDPVQLFQGEALRRLREMSWLEQAEVYERIIRPHNLYFVALAS